MFAALQVKKPCLMDGTPMTVSFLEGPRVGGALAVLLHQRYLEPDCFLSSGLSGPLADKQGHTGSLKEAFSRVPKLTGQLSPVDYLFIRKWNWLQGFSHCQTSLTKSSFFQSSGEALTLSWYSELLASVPGKQHQVAGGGGWWWVGCKAERESRRLHS